MKSRLKITFNSPVVLGFVALCLIVMILDVVTRGSSNRLLFMTYRAPLTSPFTYLRFFTHVLGHGGWEHLIGNMMYILLLGPLLEEKYRSKMIIQVIIVTALVTSIIHFVIFPGVGLLGASGVVFAFILLSSITSAREKEIPITFLLVAALFLGQQVYEGMFVQDNISNLSHILGGIVGAVFGFVFAFARKR